MSTAFERETAIHEAGHAVACLAQGGWINAIHLRSSEQIRAGDFITIRGVTRAGAMGTLEWGRPTLYFPRGDVAAERAAARNGIMQDMITTAGGPIAEAIYLGEFALDTFWSDAGQGDSEHIDECAATLAAMYDSVPFSERKGIASSVGSLWAETMRKAEKLVQQHWLEVLAVADLIQQNRYTNGGDVADLFFKMQPQLDKAA